MKHSKFRYFVLLADMRTGSNLFEDVITQYDAISCFGELFNPHFIGRPIKSTMPSLTLSSRDMDPISAIQQMIAENSDTLSGFRLFSNHNPLVLDHCLEDEACAKIILTRNPLDSYVSLKIAKQTDQWKLQDLSKRKNAKIIFDIEEFELFLERKSKHAEKLKKRLQHTGQAAFHLSYSDMADVRTFNGVAKFLGLDQVLSGVNTKSKRQNPSSLEDKVENYDVMMNDLRDLKLFESNLYAYAEPTQSSSSNTILAGRTMPIMYFPITFDPNDAVIDWMQSVEQDKQPASSKMANNEIHEWLSTTTNRAIITCPEHPVERVYRAFNDRIIFAPIDKSVGVRRALSDQYGLEIPAWDRGVNPTKEHLDKMNYTPDLHQQNFIKFLEFVRGNLLGQTKVPVSPYWGSQHLAIQSYDKWAIPTHIIMPNKKRQSFEILEKEYGLSSEIGFTRQHSTTLIDLNQVYTPQIELAVRIAYQEDYRKFGFQIWKPNN